MVLKPNYSYPEQPPNMQYPPPSGPPPQGSPYGANNQTPNNNQWQGYPPPNTEQYPPQNPPPYGASHGASSGYYGNPEQPSSYSQPPQAAYPQQNSGYNSQQYPSYPYNQQHQYPPPEQAPYGSPVPPTDPYNAPPTPGNKPYTGPPPPGNKPYMNSGYPPAGPGPQADEERGLMGALAGGAAGGYAGHKMHHGVIGTLGGAYAGHKLEDKWKEHHNKPPSPNPQHPLPPPVPHGSRPEHGNYGGGHMGNFSHSSEMISLDGDYDLIAECTNVDGHKKLSSISLNQVLTNDDGHFRWVPTGTGAGNFGGSAKNVRLVDGGAVLEAELRNCNGDWVRDRIHLDERIENSNGDLKLL